MKTLLPVLVASVLLTHSMVSGAASGTTSSTTSDPAGKAAASTPEQKMQARFPQNVKAGDLVGLPMLDWDDRTFGYVSDVVRDAQGRIFLILPLREWFGWVRPGGVLDVGRRPVAVPIETVTILGRQIDVLDIDRAALFALPTWSGNGASIAVDEVIRIAISRR